MLSIVSQVCLLIQSTVVYVEYQISGLSIHIVYCCPLWGIRSQVCNPLSIHSCVHILETFDTKHALQLPLTIIYLLIDMWVGQSDYGLRTYRKQDKAEPLSFYQQRLLEVYTPPECQDPDTEPLLAGDVFR